MRFLRSVMELKRSHPGHTTQALILQLHVSVGWLSSRRSLKCIKTEWLGLAWKRIASGTIHKFEYAGVWLCCYTIFVTSTFIEILSYHQLTSGMYQSRPWQHILNSYCRRKRTMALWGVSVTVTVDNLCHWPHFGTIFIPPHLHVYSQAVDYRLPFLFFRVNMRFCWTLNLTGYKKLGYFWRTSTHCLECWKILDSFLMEVCFGLDERNSIETLLSALVSTSNVIPALQECILLRPKSTLAATVAPKTSKKPLSTDSTGALSP